MHGRFLERADFFFFLYSVHLIYRSGKYELKLTIKPSGSWHRPNNQSYVIYLHLESGSATTQQRKPSILSDMLVAYSSSTHLAWFDSGAETLGMMRKVEGKGHGETGRCFLFTVQLLS